MNWTGANHFVQKNKAKTVRNIFSRETSISIEIKATPAILWAILINGSDYPRWNSTVISIKGNISAGERILLKSILDPKRVFKLKVKEFHPENKLVWGDSMGKRVYTLDKIEDSAIRFTMSEKIGGPLFPLFAKMIPSFDSSFEQFASDLKSEAEFVMNNKKTSNENS
jgi:uncharacterized protein YndB with AHSA1/START domain